MIEFTKQGRAAMEAFTDRFGTNQFQFVLEEAVSNNCRDVLRVMPGRPGPDDEVLMQDGFIFSIKPSLLSLAGGIIIDATGELPIVYTRRSLDERENY
jgi:hypothetical protein